MNVAELGFNTMAVFNTLSAVRIRRRSIAVSRSQTGVKNIDSALRARRLRSVLAHERTVTGIHRTVIIIIAFTILGTKATGRTASRYVAANTFVIVLIIAFFRKWQRVDIWPTFATDTRFAGASVTGMGAMAVVEALNVAVPPAVTKAVSIVATIGIEAWSLISLGRQKLVRMFFAKIQRKKVLC